MRILFGWGQCFHFNILLPFILLLQWYLQQVRKLKFILILQPTLSWYNWATILESFHFQQKAKLIILGINSAVYFRLFFSSFHDLAGRECSRIMLVKCGFLRFAEEKIWTCHRLERVHIPFTVYSRHKLNPWKLVPSKPSNSRPRAKNYVQMS